MCSVDHLVPQVFIVISISTILWCIVWVKLLVVFKLLKLKFIFCLLRSGEVFVYAVVSIVATC